MSGYEPSPEELKQYADWLCRRPDNVAAVIERFPPMTRVRAVEGMQLLCPAPGRVAQVFGYSEEDVTGRVVVNVHDLIFRADCDPDWLELVEEESRHEIDLYHRAKEMI